MRLMLSPQTLLLKAPIAAVLPLAISPIAFIMPSNSRAADLAKLGILGTVFATLFLFCGNIWVPGGATQFLDYAEAILHNTTLPPSVAQRDAGYPLIIIFSGFPLFSSLVPLLLIQAAFALLQPLFVYEGLRRLSPSLAFYSGLACILTLTSFYFMKMIHHDQVFIFLSTLMICLLLIFVQTKQIRFLYFFTIATICASTARPAGNALFPIFLVIGYIAVRGNVRHYVACVAIFGCALGAYAWHRYVIFDVKHLGAVPSYTGEQIFYNPYLNALDYNIHLSKSVGPNFSLAVNTLRTKLQPDPKDSRFIRSSYYVAQGPEQAFAEANMFPFTTDQLIDRVLRSPNSEYYALLCNANDDQTMLLAAWEIARAYPKLILQYAVRNFFHFIFNPGYKHSRYNLDPFGPEGLKFWPALNQQDPSELALLPARAAREASFDSLAQQPADLRRLFAWLQRTWLKDYKKEVAILSGLMCVAWTTALIGIVAAFRPPRTNISRLPSKWVGFTLPGGLISSIAAASLLFGYNAAVTSLFVEPDFRYRQMVDSQAILIAGLGLISVQYWLKITFGNPVAQSVTCRWCRFIDLLGAADFFRRLTTTQLMLLACAVTAAAFTWWAVFMLEHT